MGARSACALLLCLVALHGVRRMAQALPYTSLTDYGLKSLSAETYVNDSSLGISASLGGLSPSDLLQNQPDWERVADYTQRWATSLAAQKPSSPSEQERLLSGLLAVWLTAAASAGIALPGATAPGAVPSLQPQASASNHLIQLMPPFLGDLMLAPQLATLNDGRWGTLDGHLAWQNWGGSVAPARVGKLLVPRTADEVAAAVAAASAAGRRVRAVGKGHTWTPMFFDSDGNTDVVFTTLLRLPSGERIEMAGHSASGAPLVRVSAGVTVGELAQFVTDHATELGNAALPSDTVIESVRYGGVVSTGSHGTARDFGSVPDFVESLTIVDGRGQLVAYNASHSFFDQARTAFGLMGVITELTLRLASVEREPDKLFVMVTYSYDAMGDLFGTAGSPAKLKALAEAYDSIELFWYPLNNASAKGFQPATWDPYADRLMVYMTQRAAAPPEGPQPEPYSSKPNVAANLETYLGAVATHVGAQTGKLAVQVVAPLAIVQTLQSLINRPGLKTLPAAIHYGRNAIDQFKVWELEMYFRVDAAFAVPFAAWNAAVVIAKDTLVTTGSNVLNVALEARFLAQSTATMSPAYSTDSALFFCIGVLAAENTPGWAEFQQRIFAAWTSLAGASAPPKPHWAKWTDVGPSSGGKEETYGSGLSAIDTYAQRVFADQIADFRPAVAAADPKGVFRNVWLTEMFGLA
ncbi:hypothetical protein WJX81_004257 [Elliptochloris bilobata]|uniref:FAD-binding PCMH-type domain-containing protein n=1 Tax=Elliptochloris bilobata TaxID=381761 RepID=A0AAW1RTG6_9CHLO